MNCYGLSVIIAFRNNSNTYYSYYGSLSKEQLSTITEQITTPWFIYLLRFDPSVYLSKVKCPVLALNGSKDLQVPPKENLTGIRIGVESGGNKEVTTLELENLNHLFQECSTGLPTEYGTIKQTCSPKMLEAVKNWIVLPARGGSRADD